MTLLDIAFVVWQADLGQPYSWGGDNPLVGFDCSGFVIEGLKAAGLFPRVGDTTAEGLRKMYSHVDSPDRGSLLFWGVNGKATHVEVVFEKVGDALFTIGASGGGSATTDRASAIKADAYVKIRPARAGWFDAVSPFAEHK